MSCPCLCSLTQMFVKYNDLLRNFGPALAGGKGNTYVTTTHVINSVIVKMAKLTRATKVYRGVAGGVLPESFWRANAQGIKGGIESAFMSTTFDRDVAMQYARVPGKSAIVFEMQSKRQPPRAFHFKAVRYPRRRICALTPLSRSGHDRPRR